MEAEVKTFDKKQAAERLGISEATLNRLLTRAEISHVQIGRRIVFTNQILFDFIERKTKPSKFVSAVAR